MIIALIRELLALKIGRVIFFDSSREDSSKGALASDETLTGSDMASEGVTNYGRYGLLILRNYTCG